MQLLSGIRNSRHCPDTATDRLDIAGSRAGLGAAEFPDQRGVITLRLSDILRIKGTQALRRGRRDRQRGGGKQQDGSTHEPGPLSRFAPELSAGILNGG